MTIGLQGGASCHVVVNKLFLLQNITVYNHNADICMLACFLQEWIFLTFKHLAIHNFIYTVNRLCSYLIYLY